MLGNRDIFRIFKTDEGAQEFFFVISVPENLSFQKAIEHLNKSYCSILNECGLSNDYPIFTRIFLSDVANQVPLFLSSSLYSRISKGAFSLVQQSPCVGGPIGLFAYHIRLQDYKIERISEFCSKTLRNSVFVKGKKYCLLMNCHYTGEFDKQNAAIQTRSGFDIFEKSLKYSGMTVQDNTIRTWIFVRDIDLNYIEMGRERRAWFIERNLTENTRYFASTGIEAKMPEKQVLVSIDGISIAPLFPHQMTRMEAPDNMCPTHKYGITFERGMKVRFGDRSHLWISGTASIDKNGDILFEGDAYRQTVRTLENISALLSPTGASLNDLMYLIVYVRNRHQVQEISDVISTIVPKTVPLIIVEGAVCRPGWLVEIEGMAIISDKSEYPVFF